MATTDTGLRVIRASERVPETASGAMLRESAIAQHTVGAQKIWLGYVELPPGCISAVHHHGEAESGIYIISGDARFYTGEALDQRARGARGRLRVGAAACGPRGAERQSDRAGAHGGGALDAGQPDLQSADARGLETGLSSG